MSAQAAAPSWPWHRGEVALQEHVGIAGRMAELGPRMIRDHLTTIVLVGVAVAVVPVALGGLWKVSSRLRRRP